MENAPHNFKDAEFFHFKLPKKEHYLRGFVLINL